MSPIRNSEVSVERCQVALQRSGVGSGWGSKALPSRGWQDRCRWRRLSCPTECVGVQACVLLLTKKVLF